MISIIKKVLDFAKKALIVITVFLIVIGIYLSVINKNRPKFTTDYIQRNRVQIYKIIKNKKLQSSKEGKILVLVYKSIMCNIVGEACTDNPDDGDKNFKNSIFGFVANLITIPYANPPASGIYWAYNGLQNSGFVPKIFATEGIGFVAIKPLMDIWKIFRDICYLILVIVLIAIGFMIMFRMKINPQTVISLENALPRIVIALILINFSYAIAGFLIDFMYLLMAIIISILAGNSAKPFYNVGEFQNKFLSANSGVIWDSLFPFSIDKLKSSAGIFAPIIDQVATFLPIDAVIKTLGLMGLGSGLLAIFPDSIQVFFQLLAIVGSVLGSSWVVNALNNAGIGSLDNIAAATISFGKLPSNLIGAVIFILTTAILGIILLPLLIGGLVFFTLVLLFFRIFFMLLTTYLKILLLIVFGPFFALFEAIPGKNAFSYWFKNLLAEVLTFPIVTIILLIGHILTSNILNTAHLLNPASWTPPFLYGLDQTAYAFLIGVGLLLLIPDLVKLSKGLLGVKEGLPVNIGLGTFFAGASTAAGGAMGLVGTFSSIKLAAPGLVKSITGKTGLSKLFFEQSPSTASETVQPHGAQPPEEQRGG